MRTANLLRGCWSRRLAGASAGPPTTVIPATPYWLLDDALAAARETARPQFNGAPASDEGNTWSLRRLWRHVTLYVQVTMYVEAALPTSRTIHP
jgi:hypothetical protein